MNKHCQKQYNFYNYVNTGGHFVLGIHFGSDVKYLMLPLDFDLFQGTIRFPKSEGSARFLGSPVMCPWLTLTFNFCSILTRLILEYHLRSTKNPKACKANSSKTNPTISEGAFRSKTLVNSMTPVNNTSRRRIEVMSLAVLHPGFQQDIKENVIEGVSEIFAIPHRPAKKFVRLSIK